MTEIRASKVGKPRKTPGFSWTQAARYESVLRKFEAIDDDRRRAGLRPYLKSAGKKRSGKGASHGGSAADVRRAACCARKGCYGFPGDPRRHYFVGPPNRSTLLVKPRSMSSTGPVEELNKDNNVLVQNCSRVDDERLDDRILVRHWLHNCGIDALPHFRDCEVQHQIAEWWRLVVSNALALDAGLEPPFSIKPRLKAVLEMEKASLARGEGPLKLPALGLAYFRSDQARRAVVAEKVALESWRGAMSADAALDSLGQVAAPESAAPDADASGDEDDDKRRRPNTPDCPSSSDSPEAVRSPVPVLEAAPAVAAAPVSAPAVQTAPASCVGGRKHRSTMIVDQVRAPRALPSDPGYWTNHEMQLVGWAFAEVKRQETAAMRRGASAYEPRFREDLVIATFKTQAAAALASDRPPQIRGAPTHENLRAFVAKVTRSGSDALTANPLPPAPKPAPKPATDLPDVLTPETVVRLNWKNLLVAHAALGMPKRNPKDRMLQLQQLVIAKLRTLPGSRFPPV